MSGSPSPRRTFVAEHIHVLPKSGIREFFDLVSTMKGVVSLGVGEPDFVTPWNIRESGIYSLEKGHTAYTSNLGLLPLRKAICDYVRSDYHVSYRPEDECLVTIGVSEALDMVMRAMIDPGDEVLYTEPCFVSYPAEIRMAHGVPVAAFDLGGVREYLADIKNGFAVPESGDMNIVFRLIYEHPELLPGLSNAALEMVEEKFSEDMFIKKFKEICGVLP